MHIQSFFAHGGEHHETTASAMQLGHWYIDLPLLAISVVLLMWIAYRLSRRSVAVAFLTLSGCLLISGVGLYTIYPIFSAAAISIGLGATLLSVLLSLQNTPSGKKKA